MAFLESSDVIEDLFLALRSWEHFVQKLSIGFPLVVVERSSLPLKVTRHSMARKRMRQGFVVFNFSTNRITHERTRKDAHLCRHLSERQGWTLEHCVGFLSIYRFIEIVIRTDHCSLQSSADEHAFAS